MRAIAAYFPATLVAYLLGSLLSTLIIMAGLADLGMPVTFGDVVSAVLFESDIPTFARAGDCHTSGFQLSNRPHVILGR